MSSIRTRSRNKANRTDASDSDSESDSRRDESKVPILTGMNYPLWKNRMRSHLMTKGCWHYVATEIDEPSDKTAANYHTQLKEYRSSSQRALGYILKYVDQSTADSLMEDTKATAHSAWNKLEQTAKKSTKVLTRTIKNQITRFIWDKKGVDSNYRRFKDLNNRFKASGGTTISESELVECFLANIPRRFEIVADNILDETSPSTFCKIMINKPSPQLVNLGYDHSKMLFYKDTGDVSQEVWDVLLYQLLESDPDTQVAFYNAHRRGDFETKQALHRQYLSQTIFQFSFWDASSY